MTPPHFAYLKNAQKLNCPLSQRRKNYLFASPPPHTTHKDPPPPIVFHNDRTSPMFFIINFEVYSIEGFKELSEAHTSECHFCISNENPHGYFV